MVEKLNLPIIDHVQPYKLQSASSDVWITKHILVSFQIGKYVDEVLCDAVPIQVMHVLLGKAWMLRRGVKYDEHINKYSFLFNGCRFTLVLLAYEQLCIDYSMKNELDEGIVIDEANSERVEKKKETEVIRVKS